MRNGPSMWPTVLYGWTMPQGLYAPWSRRKRSSSARMTPSRVAASLTSWSCSREWLPPRRGAAPDVVELLARVARALQVLAPRLGPFHGAAEPHRGHGKQDVLGIDRA